MTKIVRVYSLPAKLATSVIVKSIIGDHDEFVEYNFKGRALFVTFENQEDYDRFIESIEKVISDESDGRFSKVKFEEYDPAEEKVKQKRGSKSPKRGSVSPKRGRSPKRATQPPKKGKGSQTRKGRPSKKQSEEVEVEESPKVKSKGRPSKKQSEEVEVEESPKVKSKGRPPKKQSEEVEVEESPKAKGKGRPSKKQSEEVKESPKAKGKASEEESPKVKDSDNESEEEENWKIDTEDKKIYEELIEQLIKVLEKIIQGKDKKSYGEVNVGDLEIMVENYRGIINEMEEEGTFYNLGENDFRTFFHDDFVMNLIIKNKEFGNAMNKLLKKVISSEIFKDKYEEDVSIQEGFENILEMIKEKKNSK